MSNVTLFCPHCELMMTGHDDAEAVIEYGCCHDCKLHFVEPNKEAWLSGERASAENLAARIRRRQEKRVRHYKLT